MPRLKCKNDDTKYYTEKKPIPGSDIVLQKKRKRNERS